jgi:hypothetical protein
VTFFRKSYRLCDNVENYCPAWQATDSNTEYEHCIADGQSYKYTHTHTLTIFNSYRFSTATIVARAIFSVTLYVNFLVTVIGRGALVSVALQFVTWRAYSVPGSLKRYNVLRFEHIGLGVGTMWPSLQLLMLNDGLVIRYCTYQAIRLVEYNLLVFMYSIGGVIIAVILLRK